MKQSLWTLPEPGKWKLKELRQWAKDQISHGVPRQVIWNYLLDWENKKLSSEEMEASMKVASLLLDVMVDRNLNGKDFEAHGEVDKAIELYEQNILDLFDGSHPYDRLRVIYTKRKQFTEAIRVCRTYAKILDTKQESSKREKYMNWIEKLEKQDN